MDVVGRPQQRRTCGDDLHPECIVCEPGERCRGFCVWTAADVAEMDPTWCCPLVGLYPCEHRRPRHVCYCHERHLMNKN